MQNTKIANGNPFTFREALAERLHFDRDWDIEISRADFDALFTKTDERITFTFHGWDGKSYDGESRTARVLRTSLPCYEDCAFIKVGKGVHMIDTEDQVVEKATGLSHPTCDWVTNVGRK
ncbi:MAG: hypothetical protein IJH09_00365 [Clostridia bacterium]|nr:hypothetical protein [Clostridia bacterium]